MHEKEFRARKRHLILSTLRDVGDAKSSVCHEILARSIMFLLTGRAIFPTVEP